jgi:hypothetical protein
MFTRPPRFSVCVLLASAFWLRGESRADTSALTPAQIAERTTPSVVLIRVPAGLGSGFAVAKDRIATNWHVISGANDATIVTSDGKEWKHIEVMAVDPQRDLAVLRVVGAPELRPLPLGDSDQVRAGEHVVAIGNPLGLGDTVSDGLVSAVRTISDTLKVLQISAPISHGSSGGPVVDDRGFVIGVSTLVMSDGQNLNFAMPINALKPLLLATEGTPIASFKLPGRRERKVPHHDLALLDGCSSEKQVAIVKRIDAAIESGAPVYNKGSIEGCFHIYAAAAYEIDADFPTCKGPRRALAAGIARADALKSFDDKAWAMRDAFDGLVDVVLRATAAAAAPPSASTALPTPPPRAVPHHPLSTLDHCSVEDQQHVGGALAGAIDAGAPLYNERNFEACYRVYAGAALELSRQLPRCEGLKAALNVGLKNAKGSATYVDKAWKMRDAFDGVLELLNRAASSRN